MIKVLVVFGTRPEAIKMAPVVKQLQAEPKTECIVCVTAQHREMLDQVLELFEITPDYDLNIMKKGQTLTSIASEIMLKLDGVLTQIKPDRVLVHGDTSTAMVAGLTAFYHQIPVGHIEAGLRTGDLSAPWPEEMNRRSISIYVDMHFAPTNLAAGNLLKENHRQESIHITGNTVIDAILWVSKKLKSTSELLMQMNQSFPFLDSTKKIILVTAHRRENLGQGIKNICTALARIAEDKNLQIVYPVHLNPNVKKPVYETLGDIDNIFLIDPLDYLEFVFLMNQSNLILTDSGGVQEEAPTLDIPVLVMRDTSERQEAIETGAVKLVGTNVEKIVNEVTSLMNSDQKYQQMAQAQNPFGDGTAAEKIIQHITSKESC